MNAVFYINSHGNFEAAVMEQMQSANKIASELNVTIAGYCFKDAPFETLLTIIQEEIKVSFDTIILFNMDAISQDFGEAVHFINRCYENCVTVFTATGVNLTTLFAHLFEANQKKIEKDTPEETNKRITKCDAYGKGRLPFGYKNQFGTIMIDESQSPMVQKIFTLFVDGYSIGTISRILAEKYDLHNGQKGRWRHDKLRGILTNPIYNGYRAWSKTDQRNGKYIRLPRDEWIFPEKQIESLVIIDNELWEMTQERLKQ
jgi:hypothetical protein